MLSLKFEENRVIRKKNLVIETPTGFEWIFQTCPIDLKLCTIVAHDKYLLNSKFGENRMVRKQVLVVVTPTGLEWISQTRPIKLKFGIFFTNTKWMIKDIPSSG